MYAAAQEVDFDQQLWGASKVVFQNTSGADQETLFFLCADRKAQILMATCKNFKAEASQAMVYWVCGRNLVDCLANFGLEATINGWSEVVLPMRAIYRHITAKRRIPDYGLHRVLRVTICGISGMRDAVSAATGKSAAVVVRNFLQPILDVARMAAKTVTKGRMAKGNGRANAKGNVRLQCAAAVQFMRTRRWEALIAVCLEEGGMNNKRVGGRPWGDVCRQWSDNFAKICIYAWCTSWLSGADLGRLRECSIAMGKGHLLLEWPKLLWSHLWIDHLSFFARQWRTLSKFSCFAMEGSHRRLKRMLGNNGGLILLGGRLDVHVIVDNHTIDDSLRAQGWDVTKRSMRGQGPLTLQQLPTRARKRALSDLNYVHTLSQRFRRRKQLA